MNQILYTTTSKKSKTLEIKTILRIFAILCILYGIFLAGQASLAMINENEEQNETIPIVEITQNGDVLKLAVTHDKIIDKITYNWNKTSETVLQGKGRSFIQEEIPLYIGENTLVLKVTDINGKTVSYSNTYVLEEGDVIDPEIELIVESSKVKIVAKDDTALNYIGYYWNDEEETDVYARADSPKQIEEKIDILKGENTLTVVAVDEAGNEYVKEQTFKAVKKPKIELFRDANDLIVKVADEEEVQKVEYTLNGQFYSTDVDNSGNSLGMKSLEFRQPLSQGENKITITAYNISGIKEEVSAEVTI